MATTRATRTLNTAAISIMAPENLTGTQAFGISSACRLAIMNLAKRGIEADIEHADTFRRDLHPDLRADTATRVSAKPKRRSQSPCFFRGDRLLVNYEL